MDQTTAIVLAGAIGTLGTAGAAVFAGWSQRRQARVTAVQAGMAIGDEFWIRLAENLVDQRNARAPQLKAQHGHVKLNRSKKFLS